MAYLPEENVYEEGIYQLELTDKVQGGPGGTSNLQGKQLANRTKYLKSKTDELESKTDELESETERLEEEKLGVSALENFYRYLYTGRDLVEVFGVSSAVEAFEKLKEKSDAGDFSGLGIGDYINIPSLVIDGTTITYNDTYENLRAEIVAFDQYYKTGIGSGPGHHVVMQMKNCPFIRKMNSTDTNTGGYNASELKTYLADTVTPAVEDAIEISLKTIQRMLSTHSSSRWVSEKVFIPTEVECIGTKAYSDDSGLTVGSSKQWRIFQIRPDRLIKFFEGSLNPWWTASDLSEGSILGDISFVANASNGYVFTPSASDIYGVAFAFAI